MKSNPIVLLGNALLIVVYSSCREPKNQSDRMTKVPSRIIISGSSTVYPISEAISAQFKASHPGIKISLELSSTGSGFKKFGNGETDINEASRPINSNEMDLCISNKVICSEIQICFDGLSVVVNPGNTWAKSLTVYELKKIWEPQAQGKITRWNQIRPEWPNEEFHLYGPDTESGTYDYFTEAIIGKRQSRGDYTFSEDDNILVQGVFSDVNALGYFGFSYYKENRNKLKLVAVDDLKEDNGKGPILPSVETVLNKTYSPLARPLFLYVNSEAVKRTEIQVFVYYYIDNAAKFSSQVGYIPMSQSEYSRERKKFNDFVRLYSK